MLTIRFGSDFVINSPDRRSHYSLRCVSPLASTTGYIPLWTQIWKGSRKVKDVAIYLPVAVALP